jgi:hypothetical protein
MSKLEKGARLAEGKETLGKSYKHMEKKGK